MRQHKVRAKFRQGPKWVTVTKVTLIIWGWNVKAESLLRLLIGICLRLSLLSSGMVNGCLKTQIWRQSVRIRLKVSFDELMTVEMHCPRKSIRINYSNRMSLKWRGNCAAIFTILLCCTAKQSEYSSSAVTNHFSATSIDLHSLCLRHEIISTSNSPLVVSYIRSSETWPLSIDD